MVHIQSAISDSKRTRSRRLKILGTGAVGTYMVQGYTRDQQACLMQVHVCGTPYISCSNLWRVPSSTHQNTPADQHLFSNNPLFCNPSPIRTPPLLVFPRFLPPQWCNPFPPRPGPSKPIATVDGQGHTQYVLFCQPLSFTLFVFGRIGQISS